jgi:hypothetical protein
MVAALAVAAAAGGCGKKKAHHEDAGVAAPGVPGTTPSQPAGPVPDEVAEALPVPAEAVVAQHLQAGPNGLGWSQTFCLGGEQAAAAALLEEIYRDAGWKLTRGGSGPLTLFSGEKGDLRLMLRAGVMAGSPCDNPAPIAVMTTVRRRMVAPRPPH